MSSSWNIQIFPGDISNETSMIVISVDMQVRKWDRIPLFSQPSIQFSSVQSCSHVQLFATPWIAACQASLSITNSRSPLKLVFIKLVMPSSHLILCRPLLLLPSIFPSIRVFSNESTLCMRWPKYWSFSFSISPSNEHPGLISSRMDQLNLLAVQGTLKSLLQHHSSKASIFPQSTFFTVQLSRPYVTTGKTIALTRQTFVGKVNPSYDYYSALIQISVSWSFMNKYWALLVLGIYKSHGHFTFFEDSHAIIHSMCPYQFSHNSEWFKGHMSKLIWSLFDLNANDLLILFSLVIHSCHKLRNYWTPIMTLILLNLLVFCLSYCFHSWSYLDITDF